MRFNKRQVREHVEKTLQRRKSWREFIWFLTCMIVFGLGFAAGVWSAGGSLTILLAGNNK